MNFVLWDIISPDLMLRLASNVILANMLLIPDLLHAPAVPMVSMPKAWHLVHVLIVQSEHIVIPQHNRYAIHVLRTQKHSKEVHQD